MAGASVVAPKYPTQYQKNWFELQLLRDKSDDRLRHIFHQHLSVNPASLYKELDTLKYLIRTLYGYKEPRTGWNNVPDPINVTLIADGIRLKIGRNQIQHLPLSITRTEYKALHKNLCDPLIRLGCPQGEIDNLGAFTCLQCSPSQSELC